MRHMELETVPLKLIPKLLFSSGPLASCFVWGWDVQGSILWVASGHSKPEWSQLRGFSVTLFLIITRKAVFIKVGTHFVFGAVL